MLRDKHVTFSTLTPKNGERLLENVQGDMLEILAAFEPGDAKAFGLKARRSDDRKNAITISYDGETLDVAGTKVRFKLAGDERTFMLHVFLDKSVMEVFVNGGKACVPRAIYPGEKDLGLEFFAEDGGVAVKSLEVWEMKFIW